MTVDVRVPRRCGAPNQRYVQARSTMVSELLALKASAAVNRSQLSAVLAFSRTMRDTRGGVLFGLSDAATAHWVIQTIGSPRLVHLVGGCRSPRTDIRVEGRDLLARLGYHATDDRWSFGGGGRDSALGAARGALVAKGRLARNGVRIHCRDTFDAVKTMALLDRIGVAADRGNSDAREVVIPSGQAPRALKTLGLAATARQYKALIDAEPVIPVEQATRQLVGFAASNRSKSAVAATAESRRIAALGDLDSYAVLDHLRQAAQFRRDRPDLTYSQAAAEFGITKNAYVARMRRFWKAIEASEIAIEVNSEGLS
ncbi:hypothetical protein [Mycobacteroides abscessus]|uniref:hypothetical protein n=3 Tax=Mycobacteroides abscessus TaxID=36809 RepID=UPI0009280549|nr:hypothetical protein [Mycobacteroides abscessus]SHY27036.1 Uncharacterized protein conserved in bacteria [Mycobacteroides abscessus subsp. abscessus]SID73245.1 Uncharacterized protein conserved in bacteria [Mycobacteroides abscessus subsp. abscessus]SIK17740.1 Uncharacterized protein conserved in bacteria [Mycobacteroides abscessus subsp. abscessus]SIM41913.1 Uncharacterized protein conserved in bacteria [Mycobacteroides abscessus subsp. abscessus]SKM13907.1 Uncharacterized protein conserve